MICLPFEIHCELCGEELTVTNVEFNGIACVITVDPNSCRGCERDSG